MAFVVSRPGSARSRRESIEPANEQHVLNAPPRYAGRRPRQADRARPFAASRRPRASARSPRDHRTNETLTVSETRSAGAIPAVDTEPGAGAEAGGVGCQERRHLAGEEAWANARRTCQGANKAGPLPRRHFAQEDQCWPSVSVIRARRRECGAWRGRPCPRQADRCPRPDVADERGTRRELPPLRSAAREVGSPPSPEGGDTLPPIGCLRDQCRRVSLFQEDRCHVVGQRSAIEALREAEATSRTRCQPLRQLIRDLRAARLDNSHDAEMRTLRVDLLSAEESARARQMTKHESAA